MNANQTWKEAGMVGPSSVHFPQCSGIEWEIEKMVCLLIRLSFMSCSSHTSLSHLLLYSIKNQTILRPIRMRTTFRIL